MMSPEKRMIVTVGTSLFESASWRIEDAVASGLRQQFPVPVLWNTYSGTWANPETDGGLLKPEVRKSTSAGLKDHLKNKLAESLTEESIALWTDWLAPYVKDEHMRYSAEMATILAFAEQDKKRPTHKKWNEYLREYEILLLHDEATTADTRIAALHLCAYLRDFIKPENPDHIRAEGICNFSSQYPELLQAALDDFFMEYLEKSIKNSRLKNLDLLVSGGLKIYALCAARWLSDPRFRVIYLHESSDYVVYQDKDFLNMGSNPPKRYGLAEL